MPSCLINYIGVKGLCLDVPDSGIYINSYPGISLQGLNDVSDADSLNWSGVWSDIQTRAESAFELDVIDGIDKNFRTNQTYRSISSGQFSIDGATTTSTANKKQGVLLSLDESKYLTAYIDTVNIYLQSAISFTLNIADAETGDLLDSFAVDGSEGHNTILINKDYRLYGNTRRIVIYYDSDEIAVYRNTIAIDNRTGASSGGWGEIRGAQWDDTDADIIANMTTGSDTFGMIVNYALNCDVLQLVCSNKKLFLNAWVHLLGREIMTERLTTERINPYTHISESEAERLYNYYSERYKIALKIACSKVDSRGDVACFTCEKVISDKYFLP